MKFVIIDKKLTVSGDFNELRRCIHHELLSTFIYNNTTTACRYFVIKFHGGNKVNLQMTKILEILKNVQEEWMLHI